MNHSSSSFLPALLGLSTLPAQSAPTFQVVTATDYSVVANNGSGEVIDGKPFNTTLTLPLALAAKSSPGASASHHSEWVSSSKLGKGLRIRESGSGSSSSATGSALAGTLDDVGPRHTEPHTLILAVTNVTAPTGIVTIEWNAHASSESAFAKTSIDLNGDLVPDFARDADWGKVSESFPVTAFGGSYFFKITTHAEVEIEGKGSGSFSLDLTVSFREGTGCTVNTYGAACAGRLSAEITAKHGTNEVKLELEDAAKHAQGALLLGDSEVDLTMWACRLLVAPVVGIPLETNGGGKAKIELQIAAPFSLRAQHVILLGSVLGSSNAVRLGCN